MSCARATNHQDLIIAENVIGMWCFQVQESKFSAYFIIIGTKSVVSWLLKTRWYSQLCSLLRRNAEPCFWKPQYSPYLWVFSQQFIAGVWWRWTTTAHGSTLAAATSTMPTSHTSSFLLRVAAYMLWRSLYPVYTRL